MTTCPARYDTPVRPGPTSLAPVLPRGLIAVVVALAAAVTLALAVGYARLVGRVLLGQSSFASSGASEHDNCAFYASFHIAH